MILRNGEPCPAKICTPYTSLTGETVTFYVAGEGTYAIGEDQKK